MTATTATCHHCSTPTAGANLCHRCTRTLLVALAHIAAYHHDLDTVAGRLTRYGDTSVGSRGSVGKEVPLPVDARFVNAGGEHGGPASQAKGSLLRDSVRTMLVGWCRVLDEEHHAGQPADTVRAMCVHLASHLRVVAASPWIGQLLDDCLDAERDLRRVIDRPADRWYAGICSVPVRHVDLDTGAVITGDPCQVDLYAVEGATEIQCPGCGITHDVEDRREFLFAEAHDKLVTASVAATALVTWAGMQAEESQVARRIRVWVHRKRLLPKGRIKIGGYEADGTPRTRPTYRLGDIQALLEEHARTTSLRRSS